MSDISTCWGTWRWMWKVLTLNASPPLRRSYKIIIIAVPSSFPSSCLKPRKCWTPVLNGPCFASSRFSCNYRIFCFWVSQLEGRIPLYCHVIPVKAKQPWTRENQGTGEILGKPRLHQLLWWVQAKCFFNFPVCKVLAYFFFEFCCGENSAI